jgi:type I restriction enzyme S subunit
VSFRRYSKYKESGVDWLSEVPEHWRMIPIKRISSIRYGIGEPPAYHPEGTPLIRATNVHAGKLFTEGLVFVDPDEISAQRIVWLDGGDIIVVRSGAYTGDSAIIPENFGRCIAGFDMVLKLHGVYPRFMQFALLSAYLKERQIDLEKIRAAQPHLNAEELGACLLLLPTSPEQLAIAAFLDRETAKIDALVAEQQRLIELLKEKRQAVISHAVTRGMHPNAPMKYSGIDWLGDVPDHWRVSKMKWVARMESGHTPDKKIEAYWENCDIPWVSLNDTGYLKDHDYISDTAVMVNALGIQNSSARILPPRVVVFSRDATIGRCAITTRPMAVSQHFIAWLCKEQILPEYLLFRLHSMTQELERLTTGATLKTIGMPDVRTIVTPVPPIQEQHEIIAYIAEQTAKLDDLVFQANCAVELLLERRTALISAAVTGKIDVRHLSQGEAA